ncbi:MAG: molybdate ABC transporter permease subunit [Paraperlucidibaca sp.]
MIFSADDLAALWLTVKLATTVTLVLLVICTPLAWWLATTTSRWRGPISALVALPLVLPPTVLGFYFLLSMGPHGVIGQFTHALGIGYLPFHFSGLVLASVCYSMPFVLQPIQNAMEAIPARQLEAAATLGAGPYDRFFSVVLPLAKPGFISASLLGFAHTVGEFGVVLMIGGNIPDQTRVVSVALYDHVEAMNYGQAHTLAAALLAFSFITLLVLYSKAPRALMLARPRR